MDHLGTEVPYKGTQSHVSNRTECITLNSQRLKAVRATTPACRKFSICRLQSMDRKFTIFLATVDGSSHLKYVVCVICLICSCFSTTLQVYQILQPRTWLANFFEGLVTKLSTIVEEIFFCVPVGNLKSKVRSWSLP